jgi:hypothetical protein
MKRYGPTWCAVLIWAGWVTVSAVADRGSVPFKPGVKIFEPNQRAMIAWDGSEEILLLSTDLQASEPTKVLEVIPMPDEPKVKKGDVEVFRKATEMINRKLRAAAPKSAGRSRTPPAPAQEAGEVTFHEKIGSHDISVTRVMDAAGFVEWVEKYLKGAGAESVAIPPILKQSVDAYLKEGFGWFVFDVVSLDDKPKTNEAIQYRFKTDRLFYPLKISRTGSGETRIELLALTPRLLTRFEGIPSDAVKLRHEPIAITSAELASLSPDMDELLKHREDMKLRIWLIEGDLTSFDRDLVAR